MKKIIALLLALVMICSLAACGSTKEEPKTDAPEKEAAPTEEVKKDEPKKEEPAPVEVEKSAKVTCDLDLPLFEGETAVFTVVTENFEKINSSAAVVIAPEDDYANFIEARECGYYFCKFETAEDSFEVDLGASDIYSGDWALYVFDGMSKDDEVIAKFAFTVETAELPEDLEEDLEDIPEFKDFYSDDTQCVIYLDGAYIVYGLDGDDIISCTSYIEFESAAVARAAYEESKEEIMDDPDIVSCECKGNAIVCEYTEASWEGLTKSLLEFAFGSDIITKD